MTLSKNLHNKAAEISKPNDHQGVWALLGPEGGHFLMEYIAKTQGDYVEIGSKWGGSAIMAATAMDMAGRPGTVYCIDQFSAKVISPELEGNKLLVEFWAYVHEWGVQQRIIAFQQVTPPLPYPIQFHKFSVGFIDGGHRFDEPIHDFILLEKRITDYIIFDNTEKEEVMNAVSKALESGWVIDSELEYDCGVPGYGDNTIMALRHE